MAIAIEITCRVCGVEFSPDRRTIVAGDWHTCPGCRDGPTAGDDSTPRSTSSPSDHTTGETP